jgi:hypothetical protein
VVKALVHPKGGSLKQTRRQVVPPRAQPRLTAWTLNLSAIGFLLVFAVTAYGGANILAFERLENQVDSLPGQPTDSILGAVLAWGNTPGVATRARSLALNVALANTPGDTAAIENALDEVIKASPTSVAAWQKRVAYQAALGAPMERVLTSFHMSALTGSHEGYFMAQRAIFGLEHWSELSEADRGTIVRDLLGTTERMLQNYNFGVGVSRDSYREIVAGKSPAERDDIRAAVTTSGRATDAILQALGM